MKVIFLDFDETINNFSTLSRFEVDPNNVNVLKCIQEKSNAKIVASTSVKHYVQMGFHEYEKTYYYKHYVIPLYKLGIKIDDMTPYVKCDGPFKELEIKAYLNEHPEIEQYVILDDEYISDSLKDHQVCLELCKGLTEEHIEPALKILNGELGFYPEDFDFNETFHERLIRANRYHYADKIKNYTKKIKNIDYKNFVC